MIKLKVNEVEIEIEDGLTVLQACEIADFSEYPACFAHSVAVSRPFSLTNISTKALCFGVNAPSLILGIFLV